MKRKKKPLLYEFASYLRFLFSCAHTMFENGQIVFNNSSHLKRICRTKSRVVLTAYNFRQTHYEDIREAVREAAYVGLGVVVMKTQAGVQPDWPAGTAVSAPSGVLSVSISEAEP